jgi:hypothetical protein
MVESKDKMRSKELIRMMQQEVYEEMREDFAFLSNDDGGRYTEAQKERAFELINDKGIRSAARILGVPRRTLQRWCKRHGVFVRRCPSWGYEWAERQVQELREKVKRWTYRGRPTRKVRKLNALEQRMQRALSISGKLLGL